MYRFIAERLAALIATIVAVSVIIFMLVRLLPGSILDLFFAGDNSATPDEIAREKALGLTGSYPEQYWRWASGAVHGDFGHSLLSQQAVSSIMSSALPIDIELVLLGIVIALAVGIPLGALSAVKRDKSVDYISRGTGLIGITVPNFWLATLLLIFTSRVFHWVPPLAYVSIFKHPWQNIQEFFLPAIAISVFTLAIVMRMVRATMLEVLNLDYVRTARAKGVPRRTVLVRHALRNALIPVVTIAGFEVGVLIGGAAVAEIISRAPRRRVPAPPRDLPARLPGRPGVGADHHGHVRGHELPRRHHLRPARPEDQRHVTGATATWKLLPRRRLVVPARWRNPVGIAGAIMVGFVVLTALLGHFVWTADPNNPAWTRLQAPSWAHPFGTDDLGRDTLARVIHGAQVSLYVGAIAVGISLCAGLLIGLVSAFYRGFVDLILMRVVDIAFAFPLLVLAILIVGLLGPSRRNAMIAIGIVYAPAFARVIRAAALEVLGFPFIESARSLGANDLRIITRHVLPNIVAPLIVLTTVYFSQAILGEAFLSFLGLGTQPPEAAWGNMLSTARNFVESSVWMSLFPGLAIMFAVLGFNFLGDGLRDVLDPRLGGVADELVVRAK